VICSHKEIYISAVRDLNALFRIRGYPIPLITSWCERFMQERWEKRFALRNDSTSSNDEGVLVLKTRFDDVWKCFSATELGEHITKYWAEWYEKAVTGNYSTSDPARLIPPWDPDSDHDLHDVRPELFAEVVDRNGESAWVPDLRKIGLLGCRWMVSRSRNTTLFNLTNVWKKMVLHKLDEVISNEGGVDPMIPPADIDNGLMGQNLDPLNTSNDEIIEIHRRSRSPDQEHLEFGMLSKRTN